MKVVATIVGEGAQVEVSAGSLPRYLEMREMAYMLTWAEERGLKYVEWMYPSGRVTITRCKLCHVPRHGRCVCDELDLLGIGLSNRSAEELEYRSQLAENMATRFAQLSIELQARASQAKSDPIEVTLVPSTKINDVIADMLANYSLGTVSGSDLDIIAANLGVPRSSHGGFQESDSSLRKRIRGHVDPGKSMVLTVGADAAYGIAPGDILRINNIDVEVVQIEHSSDGPTQIRYRTTLPGTLDKISISGTVAP